jgi:PAS domain S-box-containing protein
MFRLITSKHGALIPVAVFLTVLGGVYLIAREQSKRARTEREEAAEAASRKAALLADAISNAVNSRLAAMTAAELRFTPVDDSVSRQTFVAALDTVTSKFAGLMGISIIHQNGDISRGPRTALGLRGAEPQVNPAIGEAFRRAQRNKKIAASNVIDLPDGSRRVFVFLPVLRGAAGDSVIGYLAGELDPQVMARVAHPLVQDSIAGGLWTLLGPAGERITTATAPRNWPNEERPVRVADTDWQVRYSYEPVDMRFFRTQRIATWVIGVVVALTMLAMLLFLRKTIFLQRDEIGRRQVAEEAARTSAAEARDRAQEARDLAIQLEAAQRASQRLSTKLNPEEVVELFLGAVAEILDADVASLYSFEEEGEVVVGRRRIVFRNVGPITERLRREDIRQVRAPVAMLPSIAEAVSSGEPHVELAHRAHATMPAAAVTGGSEAAASTITIPLLIAGHMVGVASWEVYSEGREFSSGSIAFAQAMAAPAAAALRTAELFKSLEEERGRVRREALRFGAVLDQMADGVVVVDAAGHVERFNKAAEELLGETLESMSLDQWSSTFSIATVEGRPLSPAEFPLVRALRGDRIRRATFILRSPWGTERHLSCSAGPIITPDGRAAGAAMVLRDVSDEHQYAEMLRHTNRELRRQAEVLEEVNRQLREATKAKDQFLAVMSHELRTPINAIMGYSDLLDLGVKGELNAEQRAMVARVRETSRHLLGLINEVLDLAKIGAGRMDLVLVEMEVANIVDRAVQQILPMATAKGLTLTTTKMDDAATNACVIADETRLTQIIINLLSNAVKFTQSGGVDVRYGVVGENVEIGVRDTGPGIPPEQRERIFEEFYQVESGLARATGGTGLGLAIARRFAHLMGGDIRVESELGSGSEFIVTLPSSTRPAHTNPTDQLPVVVMLASSEQMASRAAADLSGVVRVIATTDPGRLASVARAENPDAVVLDVSTSDVGAWRALSALQADPGTAALKIVLIVREGDSMDAYDLGAFRILSKPLRVERATNLILSLAPPEEGGSILIADDDPHVRRIMADALGATAVPVITAPDSTEAARLLAEEAPAIALVDLLLPGPGRGIGFMARLRADDAERRPAIVVLLGKEISPDEMSQLNDAVEWAVLSGHAPVQPLHQLLREALSERRIPQRSAA